MCVGNKDETTACRFWSTPATPVCISTIMLCWNEKMQASYIQVNAEHCERRRLCHFLQQAELITLGHRQSYRNIKLDKLYWTVLKQQNCQIRLTWENWQNLNDHHSTRFNKNLPSVCSRQKCHCFADFVLHILWTGRVLWNNFDSVKSGSWIKTRKIQQHSRKRSRGWIHTSSPR